MSQPLPQWLEAPDGEAFLALHRALHRLDLGDALQFANELGTAYVLAPLFLGLVVLTRTWQTGLRRALHLALALLLAAGAGRLLKDTLDRSRPFTALHEAFERGDATLEWDDARTGRGFPSGHTSTAFAWTGTLFLWAGAIPARWRRRLARGGLALLACGVGLARIYAGAHFPLDVLAGALLGSASAWLAALLTSLRPGGPLGRAPPRSPGGLPERA